MSSQELQVVTSVLGGFPPLDALRHLAPAISSFLGPAPTLSFKRACELGSTKLLDWIWITSCTSATDRSPRWSLTNYLRSDPYYYRWQFAEALEVAAGRGDLAAVEWLFTHFSGCMAPVNVVEAAAKNGHEHVLSYLLEHDAGAESPFFLRAAMNLNGQPAMERVPRLPDGWNGPGNAVTWGGHSMLYAVENKHVEAAMWLFERPDHELGIDREGGLEANEIICAAVSEDLFELAAKVMARTQRNLNEWLIHYSLDSPVPEYVEVLLENGYFQSFEQAGRRALRPLARTGHLELLQRVVQVCEPCIAASGGGWNYGWLSALMAACQNGHLPVIRFLMEHTTWLEATEFRQPDIGSKFLLKAAAEQNSVDVLEYLVSRGVSDPTGEATCTMVYHGKLELVKWMLEHTSHISNSLIATLFCVAAGHNKVEILQYLLDLVARDSPDRTFHFKSDQIVASAASAGHLQLVEWLFARGFECSDEAVQAAARSGRLEVVKWLHEHTSAECTEAALDSAATNGHAEVVKWLYENQPKRCSREAFGLAVSKCHFKVAYLLQQQYPDHAPVQAAFLPLYLGNDFDLLLFLHHHYPAAFTPDNVARARDDSAGASVKTTFEETRNWLRDLLAILA